QNERYRAEAQREDRIAKQKSQSEFIQRRPLMDRFAPKNDHYAGKTGQRDRNLRGNAKSFARFHFKRLIDVVADCASESPLFLRRQRCTVMFQPTTNKR